MKVNYHHKLIIVFLFLLSVCVNKIHAQEEPPASTPVMSIRYFLPVSNLPYIEVNTQTKTGRVLEPLANIAVNVYFTEQADENFLGKIVTGRFGKGRVYFPASFKSTFDSLNEFTFIAISDTSARIDELSSEIIIKKAILVLDTIVADEIRTVNAVLKEKKENEWVAVADIEMKLGIKRLLGNLTVGEEETFTSDSAGTASAEFKRDSLPGDEKGNLVLVARVEDNDNYGNLIVEKTVPWGIVTKSETGFWHRSLWSKGNLAPYWLLAIAFFIIAGVWGTIFYLVRQLFIIKKLGRIVPIETK